MVAVLKKVSFKIICKRNNKFLGCSDAYNTNGVTLWLARKRKKEKNVVFCSKKINLLSDKKHSNFTVNIIL